MTTSCTQAPPEQVDVLVVGAGISGIGAACHLRAQCPGKRFVVLESLGTFGGTWHTHRYPGVRSDSDLFTFGYRFKPWTGAPIATGAEILRYLGETIAEHELAGHIRYRHRIVRADWSSARRSWRVEVLRTDADGSSHAICFEAGFLWMCQGYYRHAQGYTPDWPGLRDFSGRVVHPQHWPDDLDLSGRRVVVIGSGATAATLVPAIAGRCRQLTLLQRSPTWFLTGRNANELADTLRQLDVPAEWIHEIVRRKVLHDQQVFHRRCVEEPERVGSELLQAARAALGPDKQPLVDVHFTPRYRPWQQRVAFVPDADLFRCLRSGDAEIVTDAIQGFEPQGIRLASGRVLDADVVVTATGFHLEVMGAIDFRIDDAPLRFDRSVTWRGALFTDVPNLAWVFGYFRASWTLRVDLLGDFVCRLLRHMDARGARTVVPRLRPAESGMALRPWVEPGNFNPGYLMRDLSLLPRQGSHAPWQHAQDYHLDRVDLPAADLEDGSLAFAS